MATEIFTVPIFPLPNLVFFPETILPLHVFEPRYKAMIADVLAGDRQLGIVQLRPGWDKDYYGNPPVYKYLTVGEVIKDRQLGDGRYDILVRGRRRARIRGEAMCGLYRVAEVETLEEYLPEAKIEEAAEDFLRLRRLFAQVVEALPEAFADLRPESWEEPSPGVVADLLAHTFMDSAYDKQSILSELDVARRLRLVAIHMRPPVQPKGSRPA
jgi:Lon protease-like protein